MVLFLMALPVLASGAPAGKALSAENAAVANTNSPSVKNTGKKLPVINGKEALATVAGDPITVEEYNRILAQIHNEPSDSKEGGKQTAQRIDFAAVLDRLVNISLADHEAKNIGLDRLPAVRKQMDKNAGNVLVGMVGPKNLEDVKPDPVLERRIYMGLVKEYKIKSAVFNIKEFAEDTRHEILTQKERDDQEKAVNLLNSWATNVKPGTDFDRTVRAAIKKGLAVGNLKGIYVKPGKMPASVAAVVGGMKVGQTSPLLRDGINRFVLLKLIGVRYPAGDKKAMEQARRQALDMARTVRFNKFMGKLKKEYIKIHENVYLSMDKLDYTAKGFDIGKLEKDKRVLAEVKGGKPVTVGELAAAINKKFYHGLGTVHNSEVLKAKNFLLNTIISKRALKSEAIAEGLQNTRQYKDAVADYNKVLLFGVFMNMVVAPDVKFKPGADMAYYKKHLADYSADEMMRVRAMVFKKIQDAQNAVSMLKRGDEFHWVKANSPGQAPKGEKGLIDFGDRLVYITDLPADAQKILRGAKTGAVRLYEGAAVEKGAKKKKPEKRFYALYVEKEVPPQPKPFDEVKDEMEKKMYGEKFMEVANNWFAKLRKAYDVRIYDETLRVKRPAESKKQKP